MVRPIRRGAGIPRIRSVISWSRLSHVQPPDDDDRLTALWENWRGSVGAVRIGGTCCGTAWRLPGERPRAATAGHVLWWLLGEGIRAMAAGGPVVDNAEVVFDDDGTNGPGIPIRGYVLAHPSLDLCILDLDPGDMVLPEPLQLAPPQGPGDPPFASTHRDIAVIGYPCDLHGTEDIFHGAALRHISAGVALGPSELGAALHESAPAQSLGAWKDGHSSHDASTCPGFSGAPVFDLDEGQVVGIHVWGSAFDPDADRDWDWNDMVDLPAARCDAWLDDRLLGINTLSIEAPATRLDWVGGAPDDHGNPEVLRRIARRLQRLRPHHLLSGVTADRPDFRDLPFVPALAAPRSRVMPPRGVKIGDQRGEATCAAFAVAAAIEPQLKTRRKTGADMKVSVRMLDALARDYDEFLDSGPGTTLRGVLKGFFQNGVCPHETGAAGDDGQPFLLTRAMAKEARGITLGTYFRVAPVLSDMQMAVQQAGAVVVSAHIHKGWRPPSASKGQGAPVKTISFKDAVACPREGAHAFLVTGYTDKGFVVQNSWGPDWGGWDKRPGHALWSYADWAANVIDAWVVRLSAPAPAGFGLIAGSSADDQLPVPRRAQLLGHMIQTEADRVVERGTLGLGLRAIGETAGFLSGRDPADHKAARSYRHLVLVFHDAMLGADLIARIAARMTPQMKARRIYPIHLCHGLDELRTLSLRLTADAEQVRAGFAESLERSDPYLERHVAPVSQRLIEQYRQGAQGSEPLRQALRALLAPDVIHPSDWLAKPRKVSLLAVGTGAIPAMTCADLFDPKMARIFLAPPVTVPRSATVWRLGPDRKEDQVPGYPGEWADLLAVSLGQAADPRGTDPKDPGFGWDSLSTALTDPALIARLVT